MKVTKQRTCLVIVGRQDTIISCEVMTFPCVFEKVICFGSNRIFSFFLYYIPVLLDNLID